MPFLHWAPSNKSGCPSPGSRPLRVPHRRLTCGLAARRSSQLQFDGLALVNRQVLRPPNSCLVEGSGLPLKAEARSLWVGVDSLSILFSHPSFLNSQIRFPRAFGGFSRKIRTPGDGEEFRSFGHAGRVSKERWGEVREVPVI